MSRQSEPVAVVGMEVFLPGAPDLAAYWNVIAGGVDAITEVPADRWDPLFYDPAARGEARRSDRFYCRRGGFVDGDAEFDPTRFGIMPRSVRGTDPDQLIALDVAHRSLKDAGGESVLPGRRERAGIVLGRGGYLTPGLVRLDQRVRTANQLVQTLRELAPQLDEAQLESVRAGFCEQLGPEEPESAIGLVPNLVASRVANRLDLRGPAYTVDAACASSLVAVDHAVRELTSRRCDVMLAGGVHHCHDLTLWSVFTQLGALSPSERIRPLHRDADGVLIGEGTGVVVLKRLADAQRDGDRIYAVIRGTGVASDGRSASLFNPDPGGQIRAVRQAWEAAGLDPRDPDALQLLEAHGTATAAGDQAELATVAEVFGPATAARAVIGSVKSQIGHTMPAAGVAGLIKAALALHHETLPPTLHCDDPHPSLNATRFTPLSTARRWDAVASGAPRRAAVNAFGFGGINAHVVLEQPELARGGPSRAGGAGVGASLSETGVSGAAGAVGAEKSPEAGAPVAGQVGRARVTVAEPERVLRLAARTPGELAALLDAEDSAVLAASLPETGAAPEGPVRLGIVDPTARRLKLARKAVDKGEPWRGRSDVWFTPRPVLGSAGGRTAFVFPGLEAEFTPKVDQLAARLGLDWAHDETAEVGDVGRHGAAVFQLGRLLDTALRRLDVAPDAVAGHSVGEWTAMAAAGVHAPEEVDAFLAGFDPDALRVPGLAFAVLGTAADRVLDRLAGRDDVVLSHDNAPNQSMICGPEDAVAHLVDAFRAQGVIAQVLPFRSGFHTPMLAPYLGPIRAAAERYSLHPPHTPLWSATIAAPFPAQPAAVRELFVRHLLEPVRFRALVLEMYDAGFRAFLTLGAGQLGSLIDDTLAGRDRLVVPAHAPNRDALAQLRRVTTALWTEGGTPDARPLLSEDAARVGSVNALAGQGGSGNVAAVQVGSGEALAGPGVRGDALAGQARSGSVPVVQVGSGEALAGLGVRGDALAGQASSSSVPAVQVGSGYALAGPGVPGNALAGQASSRNAPAAQVGSRNSPSPEAGSGHRPARRPGMKLDLGGALIALPSATRGLLAPGAEGMGEPRRPVVPAAGGRGGLASAPGGMAQAARPVVPAAGQGGLTSTPGGAPQGSPLTVPTAVQGNAVGAAAERPHRAAPVAPAPAPPAPVARAEAHADVLDRLGRAGGHQSVAAEFSALLTDTTAVAAELLDVLGQPGGPRVPTRHLPPTPRSGAVPPTPSAFVAAPPAAAPAPGHAVGPSGTGTPNGVGTPNGSGGSGGFTGPAHSGVPSGPGVPVGFGGQGHSRGPNGSGGSGGFTGPAHSGSLADSGSPANSRVPQGSRVPGGSRGVDVHAAVPAVPNSPRLPNSPRPSDSSGVPVNSRGPHGVSGSTVPGDLVPVPATLRIDVDQMPYLLDHCFFRQRPGWPDEADRWPIVPATTVIDHMIRIAEQAMPQPHPEQPGRAGHLGHPDHTSARPVVAVHRVRLQKWVEAMPARDVPVAVRRTGPDRIDVGFTGFAGAEVEFGSGREVPPAVWPLDPAGERVPELTAEQLYTERWMFHGPAFQGVTALTGIGERHVRGVLTAPGAPGALFDNVGQLLGYWIMATLTERTTVFPVGMERIDLYGPEPAAGTDLDCHIRIREVTPTTLTADMQLVHAGRVWATCTGWTDRRFDTDPGIRLMDRFPGRNTLSEARPEGWSVVHERWPDLATRELIMRNVLGGAERDHYAARPPTRRRHHLLGRIAAKDAVRRLLWAEGAGDIYPAEIAVHNDATGRPSVTGVHGRDLGQGLTVSLAHSGEAAVAVARRGPCGIDLEEVTARPAASVAAACGPEERALLARTVAAGEDGEDVWFTRFWAAKEAVAKERGTGLGGRPQAYRVTAARPGLLRVEHAGGVWDVRCDQLAAPAGLPERTYVVAWTTGDTEPVSQSGETA
ncbi:beta-ketoacyl synthase N-terminal-like domain-containing protein [Streptomyces sp. NPDC094437]|uniref:beta-ketoacyl synthase N-terminal-like domain-containing protein n=1 Tax=Streptomyces sp. NPDC094437 TaxID=3366060 RepID=UPI0038155474